MPPDFAGVFVRFFQGQVTQIPDEIPEGSLEGWGDGGWRHREFLQVFRLKMDLESDVGVEPKIVVFYPQKPKMEGENKGKAYEQMDDLGGFPIFLETPMSCLQDWGEQESNCF